MACVQVSVVPYPQARGSASSPAVAAVYVRHDYSERTLPAKRECMYVCAYICAYVSACMYVCNNSAAVFQRLCACADVELKACVWWMVERMLSCDVCVQPKPMQEHSPGPKGGGYGGDQDRGGWKGGDAKKRWDRVGDRYHRLQSTSACLSQISCRVHGPVRAPKARARTSMGLCILCIRVQGFGGPRNGTLN